jgi:hypothetical protein
LISFMDVGYFLFHCFELVFCHVTSLSNAISMTYLHRKRLYGYSLFLYNCCCRFGLAIALV